MNSPILKVAVADNILNPEFLERIEVLGGSSAKEKSDTMHTLYNKLFFNVASDPENDSTIIEESRGEIEEAIKNTKGAGGKVTIFGLKPLTNLPYIIEQTNSVLDHTDKLYISGSYNFREVADISDKINTILGGG